MTAGGRPFTLEPPFHVFATQNPIEQEGTYPLPEAQLDRFMMMLYIDYPSASEEAEVVRQTSGAPTSGVEKILGPADILAFQSLVLRVPISDPLVQQTVSLVRRTRPSDETATAEIKEFVTYGAGPRAAQHLVLAAKARAILAGRPAVDQDDIHALAKPILRHRILTNFHAEAQKISSDNLIDRILNV